VRTLCRRYALGSVFGIVECSSDRWCRIFERCLCFRVARTMVPRRTRDASGRSGGAALRLPPCWLREGMSTCCATQTFDLVRTFAGVTDLSTPSPLVQFRAPPPPASCTTARTVNQPTECHTTTGRFSRRGPSSAESGRLESASGERRRRGACWGLAAASCRAERSLRGAGCSGWGLHPALGEGRGAHGGRVSRPGVGADACETAPAARCEVALRLFRAGFAHRRWWGFAAGSGAAGPSSQSSLRAVAPKPCVSLATPSDGASAVLRREPHRSLLSPRPLPARPCALCPTSTAPLSHGCPRPPRPRSRRDSCSCLRSRLDSLP